MAEPLVQDLMTSEVEVLHPDDDLGAVIELMRERSIRHVPVVDRAGELLGLVSHRDLLRNTVSGQLDVPLNLRREMVERQTVDSIMTTGVTTAAPEDALRDTAELMWENKIGCVPVIAGSRLVGILTESDFVRAVAEGVWSGVA